jgi:hypothetical protein
MKLTDEDLRLLEAEIRAAPERPPVMQGTGGLRKIRFAPYATGAGKSGGARACYVCFAEFDLVYLCAVFPKIAKANLTPSECEQFRMLLQSFRQYLRRNSKKGVTP